MRNLREITKIQSPTPLQKGTIRTEGIGIKEFMDFHTPDLLIFACSMAVKTTQFPISQMPFFHAQFLRSCCIIDKQKFN